MARVQNFEHVTKERQTVHKVTRCTYSEFIGPDNRRFLQLDTYGSDSRDFPEKISQSFQFDEEAASHLIAIIRKTFPSL